MERTSSRAILFGLLVAALLLAGGQKAFAKDVAATLEGDPRFSDFVTTIKGTGLWRVLRREKAITIFAPTNTAFETLNKNWRDILIPPPGGADMNVDMVMYQRQNMVKSSGIIGRYPESAFRGKVTRVKSAGGYIFEVDGTKPGNLVINPQSSMQTSIGFPRQESQPPVTAGPPIAADNGFVYPTDGFTID